MQIGIIVKKDSVAAAKLAAELVQWCDDRAVTTRVDVVSREMDMLVILGGDGTLLHIAHQASRLAIPVVGINLGDLGFLTEIAVEECFSVLEAILAGTPIIEERMMLAVRLLRHDGEEGRWQYALNDAVISKGSMDQLVRLQSYADDEMITTYRADGLIFSTPTGSTAYNLSAGGPLVHPALDAILVTPICPFMLDSRPILLPGSTTVRTRLAGEKRGKVKVIVDGRLAWEMGPDDLLQVTAAERPLRLVCSPHKGYFAILRNKLSWSKG